MANSDKQIKITPNTNSSSLPKMEFTGADNNTITMSVLDNGTLSFDGTSGTLFSISDSLSGTIFTVNDTAGLPMIEATDAGVIILAEQSGDTVGIGTTAPGYKLDVAGDIRATGSIITDSITTDGSNSDINISANGTGAVVVESLQIQGNQITATDSTQIAFGQQQLTDVADPTQASDAATKSYVDSQVSGIESGVSAGFAIAMSIAL